MGKELLKTLLIEDDAFYIKDITLHIDHVSSIDKNLKEIDPFSYNLALFDYRLGKMNGIELVRSIRNQNCNIPIIMFTGQGDQEVAVEAMKAGATETI